MNTTQVTSTGVAVTLAVVLAIGLLFYGPHLFDFFTTAKAQPAGVATTTAMEALATTTATNPTNTMNENPTAPAEANALPNPLPTELTGNDEVVGTGATAAAGDSVTVNYVGTLPDGTVFDASAKHGQPFTFTLGAGQVIKGWDLGVAGMKVGGKRRLIIPPSYGYGSQAVGGVIPANSTLIFEVELVSVAAK